MAIPNTARTSLLSGFPGNLSHDGPTRAASCVLKSATESNNVFGRAFTYESAANETVQAGGAGVFAGILINPKAYAIDTDYAGNGTVAEFLQMGEVYVEIAGTTPAIGDKVYFIPATGEITVDADDGATPTPNDYTEIVGATIVRHAVSTNATGGTLAVISLTGPQPA